MKKVFIFTLMAVCINFLPFSNNLGAAAREELKSVSFKDVEITDSFWAPRIERNRTVSIANMLKVYGAPERMPDETFLEAVSYTLVKHPNKELEQQVESLINKAAQDFLATDPAKKWTNLLNGELYSAGHFFEACVAFYEATGNKNVLGTALRIADDIEAVFSPGRRVDVSGHEEIKIGLLKLYRVTGDERYYNLAKFFLDERGNNETGRKLHGWYAQDHKPVVKQTEAIGHCVRAMYLYAPLTEIAMLSGDAKYKKASEKIWTDGVSKKMYLIGNFGSHRDYEDFGDPYELPNISCWNEACSGVGNIYWNQNLFLLSADSKYIDVLERCLYNGLLAAVSSDSANYFYQNVLQTFGDFQRHPWFGPNCCPPNIARLLATLGGYIYAHTNNEIYVNLYIGSAAKMKIADVNFAVSQKTNYPWDGNIKIIVEPRNPVRCDIKLRIPGWAQNQPLPSDLYKYTDKQKENIVLKVNGKSVKVKKENGYAVINRVWQEDDVIELQLPMPVRKVAANKKVIDNRGRIALERGPLVYCAESIDNYGNVFDKYLPADAALKSEFRSMLGGVIVVTGKAVSVGRTKDKMYLEKKESRITAVPYFAWANRGSGQMLVWLATDASKVIVPPKKSIASTSKISSSCGQGTVADNYPGGKVPTVARRFFPLSQSGSGGLEVICDQIEPVWSEDGFAPYLQLRPQEGSEAWVQYDFQKKTPVRSCSVYFKDDKEYCILPKSWQIQYWDGSDWKPVKNKNKYKVAADKYNKISFEPVETDKLRLVIELASQKFAKGQLGPPDANYLKDELTWYQCGVLQWQVK